jgi:hypothetical protein
MLMHWIGHATLLAGWPDTRFQIIRSSIHADYSPIIGNTYLWSPWQGLGEWLDPVVGVFDLYRASFTVFDQYWEPFAGGIIALLVFASVYHLARSFSLGNVASQWAGVIAVFALVLQTPFRWYRYFTEASFPVAVCAFTIAIAALVKLSSAGGESSKNLAKIATPTVVLACGIASAGHFITIVGPLWLLVGGLVVLSARGLARNRTLLAFTAASAVLSSMAPGILDNIASTASVNERSIVSGVYADPIWFFNELNYAALSGIPNYREFTGTVLVVGLLILARDSRTSRKRLSHLAITVLIIIFSYSIVYTWFNKKGLEIGPRPGYIALFLMPILFCVLGATTQATLAWLLRSARVLNHRFASKTTLLSVMRLSPALLVLIWVTTWTVDNRKLLTQPSDYPIMTPAVIAEVLPSLKSTPQDEVFRGRVMLLQSPNEESLMNRIQPSPRVAELHEALLQSRLPVLNMKNYYVSSRFATAMSAWFTDGRPFERNLVMMNSINIKLARMLGVRFVVSQVPLKVQDGISFAGQFGADFLYELDSPNLGFLSPTSVVSERSTSPDRVEQIINSSSFEPAVTVMAERSISNLVPAEWAQIQTRPGKLFVEVRTKGRSLLILPFEYSECMHLRMPDEGAELLRVNYLLTGLLVDQSGLWEIDFRKRIFTWSECSKGAD